LQGFGIGDGISDVFRLLAGSEPILGREVSVPRQEASILPRMREILGRIVEILGSPLTILRRM
jgi:hypothetical protein